MKTVSFTSPYDARQAELEQQRAYAEALRQQGMEAPQGGMAGRMYVGPSWTQGLAQMLKAYGGRKGVEQVGEQSQALARERAQKIAEALRGGDAEAMMQNPDTAAYGIALKGQQDTRQFQAGQAAETRRHQENMAQQQRAAQLQAQQQQREFMAQQNELNRQTRLQAAGMSGAGMPPANIQEWQAFQQMTPEQQQQYLMMKRANPYLNLGGEQVQMNPAAPGQRLDAQAVTPKPEQMPAFKADQAAAVTRAEIDAKKGASMEGIGDTITRAREILQSGKPTESTFGTMVDAGGRLFGTTPEGAPEADQLRVLGGALVSKMPRMEGPQSNFDVQNYKDMAGQVGDSTLPIERRLAALAEVERLYAKYTNGGAQAGATGGWDGKDRRAPVNTEGWSITPVSQ